jgi:DNA-binding response OmpR family regulator
MNIHTCPLCGTHPVSAYLVGRRSFFFNGKEIDLTFEQARALKRLIENKGKPVGLNDLGHSKRAGLHRVRELRKVFEVDKVPLEILNVYDTGYMLMEKSSGSSSSAEHSEDLHS